MAIKPKPKIEHLFISSTQKTKACSSADKNYAHWSNLFGASHRYCACQEQQPSPTKKPSERGKKEDADRRTAERVRQRVLLHKCEDWEMSLAVIRQDTHFSETTFEGILPFERSLGEEQLWNN